MKNVIFAVVFVAAAAVSAFAYPPAGDDENANLTDPCVSRSVWCMDESASEEPMDSEEVVDDAAADEPRAFSDMYAADPDEGESAMFMSWRWPYMDNSDDNVGFIPVQKFRYSLFFLVNDAAPLGGASLRKLRPFGIFIKIID